VTYGSLLYFTPGGNIDKASVVSWFVRWRPIHIKTPRHWEIMRVIAAALFISSTLTGGGRCSVGTD